MGLVVDCMVGRRQSPHGGIWRGRLGQVHGTPQFCGFPCNADTHIHIIADCEPEDDGDPVATATNQASTGSGEVLNGAGDSTVPTMNRNALNGHAAYNFDGTQFYTLANVGSYPYTFIAVMRQNGTPSGRQNVMEVYEPGASPKGINIALTTGDTDDGRFRVAHSDGVGGQVLVLLGGTTGVKGNFKVITMISAASDDHGTFVNTVGLDSSSTTGVVGYGGINTGQIGRHKSGASTYDEYLSADICELLFFNSALSTADRRQVEICLMNKYGIE